MKMVNPRRVPARPCPYCRCRFTPQAWQPDNQQFCSDECMVQHKQETIDAKLLTQHGYKRRDRRIFAPYDDQRRNRRRHVLRVSAAEAWKRRETKVADIRERIPGISEDLAAWMAEDDC